MSPATPRETGAGRLDSWTEISYDSEPAEGETTWASALRRGTNRPRQANRVQQQRFFRST